MPKPLVMGILNVTPDSFSDGGRFSRMEDAVAAAFKMVEEGADIIDVGGESTRPGAHPVATHEELARVIPVVEALSRKGRARVSVDTQKYEVAWEAVRAGATLVNDVSGGRDIRLAYLAAEKGLDVCLMHMRGTPKTMQDDVEYPNGVVAEVKSFLKDRVRAFEEVGVERSHLWVDPGIGFGKSVEHNLDLLRHLAALGGIGGRVMIGTSRKSFLAHVMSDASLPFELRREGTVASNLFALARGASVFRVHEPGTMRRALSTWEAILYGSSGHRAR